jgi:hypothetical protein
MYRTQWIATPVVLGAVLLPLVAPPFALIALAVVLLAVLAALVALAGAVLASPYLLIRFLHRRRSAAGSRPAARQSRIAVPGL